MHKGILTILSWALCGFCDPVDAIETVKSEKMIEGHEIFKLRFDGHTYIYFHPMSDGDSSNVKTLTLTSLDTFIHDPGCSCHYNAKKGRAR